MIDSQIIIPCILFLFKKNFVNNGKCVTFVVLKFLDSRKLRKQMLAVVEIAGTQYQVENNSTYNVPLLNGNPGDTVEFNNILLVEDNGSTTVGTPYLSGNVSAKIVEHGKGDKVLVFHKKRRKGYSKLNGHRQNYTSIEITNISINN